MLELRKSRGIFGDEWYAVRVASRNIGVVYRNGSSGNWHAERNGKQFDGTYGNLDAALSALLADAIGSARDRLAKAQVALDNLLSAYTEAQINRPFFGRTENIVR